jgi:hypothetical protein
MKRLEGLEKNLEFRGILEIFENGTGGGAER